MTSLILAQKLASVKLSKEEYDRIKWLQDTTRDKSVEVISDLKEILEKQEMIKTCRLCLKPGKRRIFVIDEDFDAVASIRNILGVEVTQNDGKPQHICSACESTLKDAARLKQTAELTQWRLQQESELITTDLIDLDADDRSRPHGGGFVEIEGKITRQWACGKCKRTFEDHAEFMDHVEQPTCRRLKCYVCETCGQKLKTLARLKRHRSIHTGELRHACTLCPYRARTNYALTVHLRVHADTRPVACACGATFRSAANLASHKRTHRPPDNHCPYCPKSYRFKELLRNHIASQHSTVKPHICGACGKAFSTRKMLCRHERRVHNRPKMKPGTVPSYLRLQQEMGSRETADMMSAQRQMFV